MSVPQVGRGVLAAGNKEKREQIIELLTRAFWMEIETVMSCTCSRPIGKPTSCT